MLWAIFAAPSSHTGALLWEVHGPVWKNETISEIA